MARRRVPLAKPRPDCTRFIKAVTMSYEPDRPPLVEYIFNDKLLRTVLESMGRTWVPPDPDRASQEGYLDNFIAFWHHMGYDFVRLERSMAFPGVTGRHSPDLGRNFAETAAGPIRSWEDFHNYPWPEPSDEDFRTHEYVAAHLPDGMGLISNHAYGMFERLVQLMGYEPLCVALYEQPDLVAAVVQRIGERTEAYYRRLLKLPRLIAVFPGDDMGFRSGTLVSPEHLRRYTLPWHKRFAQMAHDAGLPYFLHSCGQVEQIMPDLIDDVRIDAKHSFEDAILPVAEFKRRHGERIGVLGGVDVDRFTRLDEGELRRYVRGIIDACAPGGRFAIGAGNSIPDYIPVGNYLTFLDEALR